MLDIAIAKWHELNPEASKRLSKVTTSHNASAADVWGDWGRFEANEAGQQDGGEEELRGELECAAADAVDDADEVLGTIANSGNRIPYVEDAPAIAAEATTTSVTRCTCYRHAPGAVLVTR